jgi:hypothetical protein
MATIIASTANATAHLVENPAQTHANTLLILQNCAVDNTVFDMCGLNERQKLALIRLGINSLAKLRLLGKDRSAIQLLNKPIVILSLARGGTEFGINVITALAALVRFHDDRRRLSLAMDPANLRPRS